MLQSALNWLGFGHADFGHGHSHGPSLGHGGHSHGNGEGHGHTHGVIDPTIATTSRGIWAIKWSFIGLAITAALQMVIVYYSGSVALLADTIHNVGDAGTAIPLWVAFMLARRKPSLRFTHGLGRVEDLAGVIIVGIILFSALVAGWQAIDRFINPQEIQYLGWVAAAGVIGFFGNEAVAVFRIKVGREIDSAALIADGYHARVDGFTSLAVVLGAFGVWLGFPLADPIVGLVITLMIFGIVWQSARAVFTRMLDGTEPDIIHEIEHVTTHVKGIRGVDEVRARWLGHRLAVELDIAVDKAASITEADAIATALEEELAGHLPALGRAKIRVRPHREGASARPMPVAKSEVRSHGHDHGHKHGHGRDHGHDHPHEHGHDHPHPHPHEHEHDHPHPHETEHGHDHPHEKGHSHGHGHDHHHAPQPVTVKGRLAAGLLEIVDTPAGERMRLTLSAEGRLDEASVAIERGGTQEILRLHANGKPGLHYQSDRAPAEPHEFTAELRLRRDKDTETLPFRMVEPEGHSHPHKGHAH